MKTKMRRRNLEELLKSADIDLKLIKHEILNNLNAIKNNSNESTKKK